MESLFAPTLRTFWIDGLHTLTGTANKILLDTFDEQKGYIFYDQIDAQSFKANLTSKELFLRAYASDINRFGCAAIESINDIEYKEFFGKSHSWKCIKAYYAAYYAAHAILRMHGVSCTNFERSNLEHIETIAHLYGMQNGTNIEKGYYTCTISSTTNEILCKRIVGSGKKGSHEQLWQVFLDHLNHIIQKISVTSDNPQHQRVLIKLLDLKNILTNLGSNGGNWLSKVRNEISYKHINGLWYPYKESEKYFTKIEPLLGKWEELPDTLDLAINHDKPILRFLDACVFLVSLYLASAKEMASKCPKGSSFHNAGVLSLVNKINT